jgi:hypothetical protein
VRRIDRYLLALGVIATVDFAVAVASTAVDTELAAAIYVLALATLTAAALVVRVAAALPPGRPEARTRPRRPSERVVQLESLERMLESAEASSFDLHNRLRPIVREIATARLARRGVSLDRRPERAREILGARTWELVRPDREDPFGRLGRGWSRAELREVVDALEGV